MPVPPDRTETLAPRSKPAAQPAEPVKQAVVDDPDRYEQVHEHARGGLGRVVRAVDKRLGRTVAVKELLHRNDSHESRFMREALITARLEHPGIVPVHEAGRWPNGDPYYVMKLVEGRTLKELITERTTLRERLGLVTHVIAVADAVGYAHSEGVIHRDIKPSNIMVGNFGETIVVDWGLARDRKRDIPEPDPEVVASGSGQVSTVSGKVVGTPAYMAPEQARGDLCDERADVYAIGAVLYELLAGIAPHSNASMVRGTATTAEETPQSVLDRVIAGPPRPLSEIAHSAPPPLVTIVAKAMDRDPERRYPNATALAEDLRRYHHGKLVAAHSYSAWSLLRRKLAQHRGVVAMAIASAVVLAGVGVESFRRVVAERNHARDEADHAAAARAESEGRQRALELLQAETSLPKDPTAALAWLKRQYPSTIAASDTERDKAVDIIDEAVASGVARYVFRPGDWVFDAQFTPDGQTVVAAVRDGVVRAYDLNTGAVRALGQAPSAVEVLAMAPDASFVVTGSTLGEVMMWPLPGGPSRLLAKGDHKVMAVRLSPDGKRILVDRDGDRPEVIRIADGKSMRLGPTGPYRFMVADDDWTKLVAQSSPNELVAIDGDTTRVLGHTDKMIKRILMSPSGDLVFVHDGATLFAVPFLGGTMHEIAKYTSELDSIEWTHDRKTLALVGKSSDIPLIDVATASQIGLLRGHTDAIYSAQFTRDGKSLLSGSDDGTARLWSLADGTSTVLRGHDDDVFRARLSADEHHVVTASLDGSVRVWPIEPGSARAFVEGHPVQSLDLDGDAVLVKTPTSVARWDLATGQRVALFSWADEAHSLGQGLASPDGRNLVMLGADWSLELRRQDAPPLMLRGHKALITHLEFSRDGKTLYTSSQDGTLRRWDVATGAGTLVVDGTDPIKGFAVAADGRVAAQIGTSGGTSGVMIDPDGAMQVLGKGPAWCVMYAHFERVRDRLVMLRCDHSVAILDHGVATELPTDGYASSKITVSPDGELVASANSDRTVRLWSASTGRLLQVLRGHSDLVLDVAFSPDGKYLASASYDKTIRIWELATQRHRVLRGHSQGVYRVVWRGNDSLVTGSSDGTIRVWDVPSMAPPTLSEIVQRLDTATTARIDERDRPTTLDPRDRATSVNRPI
jgi:WD40 repeat protein